MNELPAVGEVGMANVQGVDAVNVAVSTVPAVMTSVPTAPADVSVIATTDSVYPEIVGVVSVGDVPKTLAPVPVSSVNSAARFALDGVPRKVRAPAAVVVVEGAAPAPPPMTKALAAKAADVAQVVPLEKYGIPPDVPAIVNAGVVVAVATETIPPVQLTLVTVPLPAGLDQDGAAPVVAVRTCPVVPVAVAEGATPAPPPYTTPYWVSAADEAIVPAAVNAKTPPEVPVVNPVPPLATANVPAKDTAPDVAVAGVRPVVPPAKVVTYEPPACLLLKVVQSVLDKYPLADVVATGILIAGAVPPLETIGAVPDTLTTDPPPENVVHVGVPLPADVKTCPLVPAAV